MHTPGDTATSEALIERIRVLEEQRSGARVNSHRHRTLTIAIRVEADAYRHAIDAEQAAEMFDRRARASAHS